MAAPYSPKVLHLAFENALAKGIGKLRSRIFQDSLSLCIVMQKSGADEASSG